MSEEPLIFCIKNCFSLPQRHLRNEAISEVLFILLIDKILPKFMENICDQFQKQWNTASSFTSNTAASQAVFKDGLFPAFFRESSSQRNYFLSRSIGESH